MRVAQRAENNKVTKNIKKNVLCNGLKKTATRRTHPSVLIDARSSFFWVFSLPAKKEGLVYLATPAYIRLMSAMLLREAGRSVCSSGGVDAFLDRLDLLSLRRYHAHNTNH